MREPTVQSQVRAFYDSQGWVENSEGTTVDAQLWEDLRGCAKDYVAACRLRVLNHLPASGARLLDAASGPIQYREYLEFSRAFEKRVCVDISAKALEMAWKKLREHGEYIRCSILELPFPDASFDAVVSLHTIYHVESDRQADAVAELIRVAKPGSRIVIVYSNPDRLVARARRAVLAILGKKDAQPGDRGAIYFHAHPLAWWRRFSDSCDIELRPWRSLTAKDSRRLIPDNWVGRMALRALFKLEDLFPGAACRHGAYPMIILTKLRGFNGGSKSVP